MRLVVPASEYLPSYIRALEREWSPDNLRAEAAAEELAKIAADPDSFVALMNDPHGEGPPVVLPDGSTTKRLPSFHRWMWDGEFCGTINFRWQPGTAELPPTCLGHIGYAVVPWKRDKGYATRALGLLLPEARLSGLPYVELTTDESNVASRKVIEANGGVLFERFNKPANWGGARSLRYRIDLR